MAEASGVDEGGGVHMKPPYHMTKDEWEAEKEACRPDNMQTNFTRNSGSEFLRKFNRLQFLNFGVHEADSQKMRDALAGRIVLSKQEAEEIMLRLDTPIRYNDVIEKAKREGCI